jgi:VanZ family protein
MNNAHRGSTVGYGSTSKSPHPAEHSQVWLYLWIAYSLLLVYGTLYPLSGWQAPAQSPWKLILQPKLVLGSRVDFLTNILVYIPFGLLAARSAVSRLGRRSGLFTAALAGGFLSLGLEFLQTYLPGRTPSFIDIVLNIAGSITGAMVAASFQSDTTIGRWLLSLRRDFIRPGSLPNLGLLVLSLWALSQLIPLVPSLDVGNIRNGLKPLWHVLRGTSELKAMQTGVYALTIAGLGWLASTLISSRHRRLSIFAFFVTLVLMLKVPVVSRQLSAEALLGSATGLVITALLVRASAKTAWMGAVVLLLGSVILDAVQPGAGTAPSNFNWIPFRGHLANNLAGIGDILESLWPFMALSYLALLRRPRSLLASWAAGGLCLFALAFALEWNQQYLAGRYGDITDAVLAWIAWTIPWLHPTLRSGKDSYSESHRIVAKDRRGAVHRLYLLIGLAVLGFGVLGTWLMKGQPHEQPLDESKSYKLPPPEALPAPELQDFNDVHPRLPSPSIREILQLRRDNPSYFQRHMRRAQGGEGDFYSVTLSAFVHPGSQDLKVLHRRLMDMEFSWRGHEQVKPLAVAYDWLYDQWTEEQRSQLRDKLAEGTDYLIFRIREKSRLSPYNVILYNSPFQALIASTLALYGDHPRGDFAMRFTYDLWMNRVLPVWQQVMGRNGGWHEGGEYVGIGIGQAVYQVPAMWRKATGQDLFVAGLGIRGFLDFLVYRTRPDGTHFRWGDAGFFERRVPDRVPLAIEYRHFAAYSQKQCPKKLEPTSWPWGPLPRPELCSPDAITRLPWTRHFDGIGLVVARSDWTPDATYVTFKAGNNYWSHSHLDQGAFTIYKGGALAIDSGLYFDYGCDHHMNYTYQTIAHNTVTVTDPEDTVPAPRKEEDRLIANDGGQRRIGSGWGVEPAPLDFLEWEQKRDIYHTGKIEEVFMDEDLVVAVADITPAYTNELSGEGSFSHRTRRVERFWRTFAYDRLEDVIVVFDRVTATRAAFPKRWLLHSIDKPTLFKVGFKVEVSTTEEPGHPGGVLHGTVLLPREAIVERVGGIGAEFLVDGTNFDEQGKVAEAASRRRQSEPGNWRIEVKPPGESEEDVFLVVLTPSLGRGNPHHQIQLLEDGDRMGCEIKGSLRTTRWWFLPEWNGVEIEIHNGGAKRHITTGSRSR